MLPRLARGVSVLLGPSLVIAAFSIACEKVPLLAPSGSTLTLTAAINALSTNASTEIIAQVVEAAGTPPHSGTHITFTTTLGTIEPAEASTDVNGRAVVRFSAGSANGVATITASSGGATTGAEGAIVIAVGTAAVGAVIVSANPATVPNDGGTTTIVANVLDINGNALSSAPVTFSTTTGSVSPSLAVTNQAGLATSTLTTGQEAEVTATVGGFTGTNGTALVSSSVTVTVSAAPTVIITPPASPPTEGLPSSYTFAVSVPANGSAVRSLIVNWGDGIVQDLGAISGSQTVSHVYDSDDTFVITATVEDASGNTTSVSTSVTVIPITRPTVLVTPSPQTVTVGGTVTFIIQVTVPPGIGIVRTAINFGDGTTSELGGASSVSVPHPYAATGTFTVTVSVTDTAGQVTEGTTVVTVTP
jgi:adhesin/invasin